MLSRKLLIVDDDKNTLEETIPEYEEIYRELKELHGIPYNIEFIWEPSINSALERLNKKDEVIDIILVDYDFNCDDEAKKGIYLVKEVRKTINKRCKIIFYTMHGINILSRGELVDLVNNDVYRFLSKSGETFPLKYEKVGNQADQMIVEAIIDAVNDSDPISNTLEKYLVKYQSILSDIHLNIDEKKYSVEELISSIRLYQDPGNKFVNNLLEMSVLQYFED
jgi:hypothetical protein